jgi:hypothetical protein
MEPGVKTAGMIGQAMLALLEKNAADHKGRPHIVF